MKNTDFAKYAERVNVLIAKRNPELTNLDIASKLNLLPSQVSMARKARRTGPRYKKILDGIVGLLPPCKCEHIHIETPMSTKK